MQEVTFMKDWRGHKAGDTVELTDDRAIALEAEGYFSAPSKAKSKKAKATDETSSDGDSPKQRYAS